MKNNFNYCFFKQLINYFYKHFKMLETKESPNEEETFDKLTIKAKDTNEIEYLIIFEALTDSIEISYTQINNEYICYNTNLNFY